MTAWWPAGSDDWKNLDQSCVEQYLGPRSELRETLTMTVTPNFLQAYVARNEHRGALQSSRHVHESVVLG
jgi:hypothetical protein